MEVKTIYRYRYIIQSTAGVDSMLESYMLLLTTTMNNLTGQGRPAKPIIYGNRFRGVLM